jgi:hypothetical protein
MGKAYAFEVTRAMTAARPKGDAGLIATIAAKVTAGGSGVATPRLAQGSLLSDGWP